MTTNQARTGLGSLLPLALAACAQAPAQETPQETPQAPAGEELAALEAWAAEIAPQVEALRGLSFERPVPLAIATREDFRAYAERQLDSVGDAAERDAVELTAKLLGLFPAEGDLWGAMITLLEGQVGGYYDPESKSFSLMSGVRGALAKSVLSHELVHALEDQHFDLGATLVSLSDATDRQAAFHAVVEGTATLVQNRWMLEHGSQFSLDELLELSESMSPQAMFDAEPFLWLPTLFSYMGGQVFLHQGGNLLAAARQAFEVERLDRAFGQPPVSTEQVLHPEKYWEAASLDLPRPLGFEVPEGWEVLHEDVLGELQLALVALGDDFERPDASDPSSLFSIQYTNDAATGWDGDRLRLMARGDERLLVLASHWDSETDRDEWHAAVSESLGTLAAAAQSLARTDAGTGRGHALAFERGTHDHLLAVALRPGREPLEEELLTIVEGLELEVGPEATPAVVDPR